MWRTSEERRMSDLTRVLEWLQRRQGKKKQTFQVCTWRKDSPGSRIQHYYNRETWN